MGGGGDLQRVKVVLGGMRVVALSNIGTIFNKIKSAVFKLCGFSISEGSDFPDYMQED